MKNLSGFLVPVGLQASHENKLAGLKGLLVVMYVCLW